MSLKRIVFTSLILFFCLGSQAQKYFLGFGAGSGSFGNVNQNMTPIFTFGISTEYKPKHAPFSVSAELQYISQIDYLQLPLSINFLAGNRLFFRISGGIVPLKRLGPIESEGTYTIGWKFGLGFDYRMSDHYVLGISGNIFSFPRSVHYPSHYDASNSSKESEGIVVLSLGLKYIIFKE